MGAAAVPVMIGASLLKTVKGFTDSRSAASAAKKQGDYQAQLRYEQNAEEKAPITGRLTRLLMAYQADAQQPNIGHRRLIKLPAGRAGARIDINSGSARDVVKSDEGLNETDRDDHNVA